jgi:hypothetical protein
VGPEVHPGEWADAILKIVNGIKLGAAGFLLVVFWWIGSKYQAWPWMRRKGD